MNANTYQKGPWGLKEIPLGKTGQWKIGNTSLFIEAKPVGYVFAYETNADESIFEKDEEKGSDAPTQQAGANAAAEPPQEEKRKDVGDDDKETSEAKEERKQASLKLMEQISKERPKFHLIEQSVIDMGGSVVYTSDSQDRRVTVTPIAADRPVIVKASNKFFLGSGGTTSLFVYTPIWIAVKLGEKNAQGRELKTRLLSDTWYGPNTMTGEFCYDFIADVLISADQIFRSTSVIFTKVKFHNASKDTIAIDKIRVPLPNLSVFSDQWSRLWTEEITMTVIQDDLPTIKLSEKPPAEAIGASLLSGPRIAAEDNVIMMAFNPLIQLTK
ncbi:MAG: hypothetical protein NUW37_18730 [Planctomycetes bacterium]|nr:hypothetical protein [Planctomycetota bacterium]